MGPTGLIFLFLSLITATSSAQQRQFPAWMEEADFSKPAVGDKFGFNEPQGPVDPSTGRVTTTTVKKNSAFGKPILPDFKKMREKALKSELEQKAKENNELEQSYKVSLKNIEQLQARKKQLEILLAANPGDAERHKLLQAIGDLDNKISLSKELATMMDSNNQTTGGQQTIASLTPEQYRRAKEIGKLLFPDKGNKSAKITPPKSLFPDFIPPKKKSDDSEDDETEYQPKPRQYKPGQIKPFYQDLKKALQQTQEEYSSD